MEESHEDPVPLVDGITLDDVQPSELVEFEVNVGASCSNVGLFNEFNLEDSDDDSDSAFENLQESVDKLQLSPPEYENFDQLALQMKDCVPNGYVKLLVLEEGDGPLIPETANVTIHYAVYWENATLPFDSTITMNKGKPLKLQLGEGKHLAGLELGLTNVKGPKAKLYLLLHPIVTWGILGIPPRIKPERSLFVVTVFDVTDKVSSDLPEAEEGNFQIAMEKVEDFRKQGKINFARKDYRSAIKSYEQGITTLIYSHPETKEELQEVKEVKVKFHVNLALCYTKLNKPKVALLICETIDYLIGIDKHCKALYLRGKAYEMLNKDAEAISCYKKAFKLDKKNTEIAKALSRLDKSKEEYAANEKVMWKKAFNFNVEKQATNQMDQDFQDCVKFLFEDLAEEKDFVKVELPGLSTDDRNYIKESSKEYKNVVVIEEDDEDGNKTLFIVKIVP